MVVKRAGDLQNYYNTIERNKRKQLLRTLYPCGYSQTKAFGFQVFWLFFMDVTNFFFLFFKVRICFYSFQTLT